MHMYRGIDIGILHILSYHYSPALGLYTLDAISNCYIYMYMYMYFIYIYIVYIVVQIHV